MNIQGWSPLGRLIDLFAVQRILKSLLQHHNLKPSTLLHSDFLWYKSLTSIHDYWKKHVCLCVSDSLQFHGLWPPPGSSAHGDSPGKNPGVCFYALLQGIFPTQGSNLGLPHCRQILYCLSHQGSPGVKTIDLTIWTFVGKVMSTFFNMLYRLVIAFLPRSKHLWISWLQSPSTLIL